MSEEYLIFSIKCQVKGSRNHSVEVWGHKLILLSSFQELSTILVPDFLNSLGEIPVIRSILVYACILNMCSHTQKL